MPDVIIDYLGLFQIRRIEYLDNDIMGQWKRID